MIGVWMIDERNDDWIQCQIKHADCNSAPVWSTTCKNFVENVEKWKDLTIQVTFEVELDFIKM